MILVRHLQIQAKNTCIQHDFVKNFLNIAHFLEISTERNTAHWNLGPKTFQMVPYKPIFSQNWWHKSTKLPLAGLSK